MTLERLHRLGDLVATKQLDDQSLLDHPFIQATPPQLIRQLLDEIRVASGSDPHAASALAAVGWAAARHQPDKSLLGAAAIAYGCALVRAECPEEALPILDAGREISRQQGDAVLAARCDWQEGVALRVMNHYSDAVQKLTGVAEQLTSSGNPLDAGRCLRDLAVALNLQQRADLAEAPLEKAKAIFREAEAEMELACCRLPDAARLQWLGYYDQALAQVEAALPVLEAAGLVVEQGIAHYVAAFVFMQRDTLSEALGSLTRARAMFERAGLRNRLARCDNVMGAAYLRSIRPRDAISHLESAASHLNQSGLWVEYAQCQANLAIAHMLLGQYGTARQKIIERIPRLESAGLERSVAACRTQLGRVMAAEDRLEEALAQLETAWHTWQRLECPLFAANTATDLADTYRRLGVHDQAVRWLREAEELYRAVGSGIGLVRTWLELSRLCAQVGDLERAQELAIAASDSTQAGEADLAVCERRLGEVAAARGEWQTAAAHHGRSTERFDAIGMQLAALESRIARHLVLQHVDAPSARSGLVSALEICTSQSLPELAWRAATGLAQIEREAGDAAAELGHLTTARHWLSVARRRLTQPMLESGYLAERLPGLERGLDLSLELDRPEQAMMFNDETRSQALTVHTLGSPAPRLPTSDGYTQSLLERRRELSAELTALGDELRSQRGAVAFSADQSHLLERRDRVATAYNEVCTRLQRASRQTLSEPADVTTVDIQDLVQSGYLCLAYHLRDNLLIIFAITPDGVTAHRRALTQLDRRAMDMCARPDPQRRALIYRLAGSRLANPELSQRQRRRLYDLLIPPAVEAALKPERPLVVVPHGLLHGLSFPALLDRRGRPLVERASVAMAPSLSLLQVLLQLSREPEPPQTALVVAVRSFGGRHADLEHVREEAEAVRESLAGPHEVLLDEQATVENVRTRAGRYRLIHLATHGFFDPRHGRLSGFALSDGDLWLDDLPALGLSSPLVVLSACETGLGLEPGSDGSGSVAGAFLAMGARSVIGTLWPVHDRESAQIVADFYRELGEGASPAVALAGAQRSHLDLAPYQWAALAAFGAP